MSDQGAEREVVVFKLESKPTPYVRMTQRGKFVKPAAQRYLNSKAALAWQMRQQMGDRALFGKEPLKVEISFCYASGADHRRDLDNEVKAVLDAANGVVWEDDRWVDVIYAHRVLSVDGSDYVLMTVGCAGRLRIR